jgi:hypothetical protein
LYPFAQAEVARLFNSYIDRYSGVATFAGLQRFSLSGNISSIIISFTPGDGLTTSVDMRTIPATPRIENNLPQGAINYLLRQFNKGDEENDLGETR